MLRDVTLGQYFPGNTPVHRMDPRTKILLTIGYIVILFVAKGAAAYGAILIFLGTAMAVSRISPKIATKGMKPLLFVILFTAILNIFYTAGDPLFSFWKITVTKQGVVTAIYMVLRIMLLITGTFLLTYTTSPILLTDGIERLLSPFKRIGLPAHELAMMMTIALRFIPTLLEETDKIMNAQKARGANFEEGSIFQRAKALVPLLVPLFISAFRRADELAVAMECRCYRGGEGRTRLRVLKFGKVDLWGTLALLLTAAAVIVCDSLGLGVIK